ncbi:hypothetical protein [Pontibacter oryzae]|uniref:DUF4136 domain-containing protein n=1 Tax=Pontibacter oryzae TaxID=2304593 RepID=A0A399S481_9BACT|nr:hypothetical protein [Pontibacter oryzae]RIJ37359.1 hypothetical protein D1627_09485 [Pontibacter oryzae]
MKTSLSICLMLSILLFSGCAVSSTNTANLNKSQKYYVGIVTLVVNIDQDFSKLDSVTYNKYVRGKFNNLENLKYRKQLEKSLERNLSQQGTQTRVIKSEDLFELNTDVSYSDFLDQIEYTGADGILLVNQRSYWTTVNSAQTVNFEYTSATTIDTEPNADFHSYLIDTKSLQPVWYANTLVQGVSAGYDTLNNYLARALYRKLRKDKCIITEYALR